MLEKSKAAQRALLDVVLSLEAGMALKGMWRVCAVLAAFTVAGMSGGAVAQMPGAPSKPAYSPIKQFALPFRPVGLWDKPNEACMTKCQAHVQKGCFKRLSELSPAADAGAIQDMCDDKYSVCLYDCMCETCDENQIIIKEQ